MKPGWPDLLVDKRLQRVTGSTSLCVSSVLDSGVTEASLWRKNKRGKQPRSIFCKWAGGSKIKSAATVSSSDRNEHIVLELVSNAALGFALSLEGPRGLGVHRPFLRDFYLLSSVFVFFLILHPLTGRWWRLSKVSIFFILSFGLYVFTHILKKNNFGLMTNNFANKRQHTNSKSSFIPAGNLWNKSGY